MSNNNFNKNKNIINEDKENDIILIKTDEENLGLTKSEKTSPEKKKKKPRWISNIILLVCTVVFIFSLYNIIVGFANGAHTNKQQEDLKNLARSEESIDTEDNENVDNNTDNVDTENNTDNNVGSEVIPSDTAPNTGTPDPTLPEGTVPDINNTPVEKDNTINNAGSTRSDEEKTNDPVLNEGVNMVKVEDIDIDKIDYLKVNLSPIVKLNKDTKGWFYFPGPTSIKGLPIDISIVQTDDNDYYLTHSFDKSYNVDGWVFADYDVNMDNITSNRNTVIYGHARSYEMFGGLKDLGDKVEWYTNANNHFIKINTLTEETVWQIFSWYETNVNFNYIKTEFASGADYVKFATEIQSKSDMPFFEKFEFNENDKIITLSTCKGYNKDVRVAVHAKLVKSRKKK